ncbi:MAG TPA: hypothetical protein DCW35_01620 [Polynucleobacter sp.]|nr:hypothetical protein [Polynucleobacter sp.]
MNAFRDKLLTTYAQVLLFDSVKFLNNLENLYLQMQERYTSWLPPAQITAFGGGGVTFKFRLKY